MIGLPTETIKLERFEKGKWADDGRYKKGKGKVLEILASVQPASGNQIKILPEHRRSEESIVIFTEEQLRPTDEKKQKSGDVIKHSGKCFEILIVKDWSRTCLPHFESIGVKIDGEGGGVDL